MGYAIEIDETVFAGPLNEVSSSAFKLHLIIEGIAGPSRSSATVTNRDLAVAMRRSARCIGGLLAEMEGEGIIRREQTEADEQREIALLVRCNKKYPVAGKPRDGIDELGPAIGA